MCLTNQTSLHTTASTYCSQRREEGCPHCDVGDSLCCDITGHCVHAAVTYHHHHPSGGAGHRAGAAEAGEEGRARGGGIWEVTFYSSSQMISCQTENKLLSASSMNSFSWPRCFLQELAGGVSGQWLQQQHSIHSSLFRGTLCRGHLHHHWRALWSDNKQALYSKGKRGQWWECVAAQSVVQMHKTVADPQVEKATMTEGLFPEPVRVRPKERGGRWGHASPFMRGSTIVRSQTFSPGARSQYVCRVSYCKKGKLSQRLDNTVISLCCKYSLWPVRISTYNWILPFSYIAATVTARRYQRNRLLSETPWKEELCDINR